MNTISFDNPMITGSIEVSLEEGWWLADDSFDDLTGTILLVVIGLARELTIMVVEIA
jgi:hypothetical protein